MWVFSLAQKKKVDSTRVNDIEKVVISGTTFLQNMNEIPIPIKVISNKQIEQAGMLRLNDVLSEQTGLIMESEMTHGIVGGLQMQGLGSEYTSILINGNPLIGRITGKLNIPRISVNNIKQIEIVKGPSSSLFGSDALAGVINIVTNDISENSGTLSLRTGTNTTIDFNGDVSIVKGKFSALLSADRYSTEGYKFPLQEEKTIQPFDNYTYTSLLNYDFSSKLSLNVYSRLYNESGYTKYFNAKIQSVVSQNSLWDFNIAPKIVWKPTEKINSEFRFYRSRYQSNSDEKTNGISNDSKRFFIENYYKGENFTNIKVTDKSQVILGIGCIYQNIKATQYDSKKHISQYYALAQVAYKPFDKINILAGLRYDKNTAYGQQVNPKVAMDVDLFDWLTLRGSIGRGFKAPDMRQLYLNHNNFSNGYAVYGRESIVDKLNSFERSGISVHYVKDLSSLEKLKAETSWAYNFGGDIKPFKNLKISANIFRNSISNLINATVVAKTKYDIYTYENIQKMYTQGIETEIYFKISKNVHFMGGYQYLDAKDQSVLDDLKSGKKSGVNDSGQSIVIRKHNYFGIEGRSKHTFNAKIFYQNNYGTFANLRGIFRGRYGSLILDHSSRGDSNGIINNINETVPPMFILNASVGQTFAKRYTVQMGVDNMLNKIRPKFNPEIPGRLYWVELKANF